MRIKAIILQKILSVFSSILLLVNSFAPYGLAVNNVMAANTPLESKVTFDNSSHSFNISVNSGDKLDYLLSYKTPTSVEGTAPSTVDASSVDFSRVIYAGVKSGADAHQDTVVRAIFKVKIDSASWTDAQELTYENGALTLNHQYQPQSVDLTSDETNWLNNGDVAPTPTATPTPTVQILPTATPTPTVEQGQILDGASTQNFASTPSGQVSTSIIQTYSCRADLLNSCVPASDFSPTDVAVIKGTGFSPNADYTLRITSSDQPVVDASYQITTDKDGSFTYSYQLDGNYRPNYAVELLYGSNIVATTTFTDGPTGFKITLCHWDSGGGGKWTSNDVNINSVTDCSTAGGHGDHANDIIPSINYSTCSYGGKNLTTLFNGITGQAILNNNCNIPDQGTLKIVKNTVGGNGTFNFSVTGSNSYSTTPSITTNNNTGTYSTTVAVGSYSVTETQPSGWDTPSYSGCSNINVTKNHTSTCTITNTKLGSIVIVKNTVGADGTFNFTTTGGSNLPSSFSITTTGGTGSNTYSNMVNDQYKVTETVPAGYSLTDLSCSDPSHNSSTSVSNERATINLDNGETVTCTFTNTQLTGSISGYKYEDKNGDGNWDWGESGLSNWKIFIDTNNNGVYDTGESYDMTASSPWWSVGQYSFSDLVAGTYHICEVQQAGWTNTDPGSVCQTVTIPDHHGDYTISDVDFGNRQQPTGTLLVKKHVVNSGAALSGGKSASDFTLSVTGTGANPNPSSFVGSESGTSVTVNANATYNVTEGSYSHYSTSFSSDCNSSVSSGSNKTCTVTNTYVPFCGDGHKDAGEQCDGTDGVPNSDFKCASNCTLQLNNNKVNICHRTSSQTNPYVSNSPSKSGDVNGHDGDNGPVWYPGITVDWGDIIPPFWYLDGSNNPQYYAGKNWPTGQSVLDAGCKFTDGTLTVHKQVDTIGDGTYDVTTDSGANAMGFGWNLDDSSTYSTFGATNSTPAGDYTVYEKPVSDYHLAGWFLGEGSCSESKLNTDTPAVSVVLTQSAVITLCNARDTGDIQVTKIVNPSDSSLWDINVDGQTTGSYVLGSGDSHDFTILQTGTYSVTESGHEGTDASDYTSSYSCYSNDKLISSGSGTTISELNLDKGQSISCTFTNTKLGHIIVQKFTDPSGFDQSFDFTMTGGPSELDQDFSLKDQGTYDSGKVLPGEGYKVSENSLDGWTLTNATCDNENNPDSITVSPGETVTCTFNNQYVEPSLQISKTNDATGDKSPGDTVIYTITLKALNNLIHNVVLKDLLPKGFTFQNVISIIKNGTDDITGTVGDPHYHSPGTYNIGDMSADDQIIVTYQAKVNDGIDPGSYKDLAMAQGTDSRPTPDKVIADPQVGGVGGNFVGTAVNVNSELTNNGNVNISTNETGQVLGASTSNLPSTGGNTLWVILAAMLSVIGLILMTLGFLVKKKVNIKLFGKVLFGLLLMTALLWNPVRALASNLSIRLEEPKSPTAVNNFKLAFVALDFTDSPSSISVVCYKKGPSDGAYHQFDSTKTLSAGGNTDTCQVDSTVMSTNGTYQFYVEANNGSEVADSQVVSVDYNTSNGPSTPTNYSKTQVSSCQYKITFTTANDGKTTRVEVYRSTSTSFNLDGTTRAADITIGPNQNGSFTESVPDCSKTWYYVIRAFDSLGNGSGTIGDSVTNVTTTTVTTTGTPVQGAIPVVNANIPGAGGSVLGTATNEGNVLGEATPSGKPEVINVSPSGVKGAFDYVAHHKKIVIGAIIILLAIVGGAYYVFKKNQKA